MRLEDQVCNLELSKRLKELGVRQDSLFWWHQPRPEVPFWVRYSPLKEFAHGPIYSAFTVAELGEMLYDFAWSHPEKKKKTSWTCLGGDHKWFKETNAITEADARAKMLVYLLEQKIVTSAQLTLG